jgi:hypothetical protein
MQCDILNALYVLEVDYSKFDSTITYDILNIENKFMKVISHLDEFDFELFHNQQSFINTKFFSAITPRSRRSGVLMTSLGNTIINAFVVIYASSISGIPPINFLKFKFEGDDSVTFANSHDASLMGQII